MVLGATNSPTVQLNRRDIASFVERIETAEFPGDGDQRFRTIVIAIPDDRDQWFRLKVISDSGIIVIP